MNRSSWLLWVIGCNWVSIQRMAASGSPSPSSKPRPSSPASQSPPSYSPDFLLNSPHSQLVHQRTNPPHSSNQGDTATKTTGWDAFFATMTPVQPVPPFSSVKRPPSPGSGTKPPSSPSPKPSPTPCPPPPPPPPRPIPPPPPPPPPPHPPRPPPRPIPPPPTPPPPRPPPRPIPPPPPPLPPPPRPPSRPPSRPPTRPPPPRPPIKWPPPRKKGGGKDSPLVFDMDHDGQISAVKGIGVNMNSVNPNIRNGAAAHGDKMLAMCDFSGNGEIDYREVFGDGTVDPFTGTELKAANGFIALQQIAFSAVTRFDDLNIWKLTLEQEILVNVQQLRVALRRIQCDLGFISGHNIHNLEPLNGIEWVRVSRYLNAPDDTKNGIVFAQESWYLDSQGLRWGVDDVWFPAI